MIKQDLMQLEADMERVKLKETAQLIDDLKREAPFSAL